MCIQPAIFLDLTDMGLQPEQGEDSGKHLTYLGVSENSVPLNPMVNDHYPY